MVGNNSERSTNKILVVATCAFDNGEAFKVTNAPIKFGFTETSTSITYDMFTALVVQLRQYVGYSTGASIRGKDEVFLHVGEAKVGADMRAFLRKSNSCW